VATRSSRFIHTSLLSDEERALWHAFVGVHAAIVRQLDDELGAAAGLSLSSFEVLYELIQAPGNRLRMSDLADRLRFTRGGITRLIDRLERAGYVERSSSDDDGRGIEAAVTRLGFEVFEASAPAHIAGVRRVFFDHLAGDAAALGRILERLRLDAG
jgi:DNA-binding MarR family transcriptional regulator